MDEGCVSIYNAPQILIKKLDQFIKGTYLRRIFLWSNNNDIQTVNKGFRITCILSGVLTDSPDSLSAAFLLEDDLPVLV